MLSKFMLIEHKKDSNFSFDLIYCQIDICSYAKVIIANFENKITSIYISN